MSDDHGWTNRQTWNVAFWLDLWNLDCQHQGSTNRLCEATRTMGKSAWVAMLRSEYPVTGDGVKLTDSAVNWDEIYSTTKTDWSE